MSRFIVTDPNRCIACRTCEVACVVAHTEGEDISILSPEYFAPRIHVIQTEEISTAITCRQCEDAPCARVCPNQAIKRINGVVQVQQELCIGTKTCEVACPYGVIEVRPVPVIKEVDGQNTVVGSRIEALMCDLCVDRSDGPACLKACPTKAIHCMDQQQLQEFIRKRKQASQ
ncbi:4Fe-4S dicluster domain-containing protein [Dongshaea marina]|uniref:4Fe-4S dicluster domain-containing protein n=1 Tax=Dongshaea marina TaxID=2047966 RepID=UPI000D3E0C1F|nr:4Fe-4S dicluster domain-containing protein [Dongshaea marina]